jgi:Cell division control protein 14, SIN component
LLAVTALFKERETSRPVKLKVLEFLYFYLMDEEGTSSSGSTLARSNTDSTVHDHGEDGSTGTMRRVGGGGDKTGSPGGSNSGVPGWAELSMVEADDRGLLKTTREKQKQLEKYLSNVDDLVQDLRESRVFQETVA